MTTHSRPDAFPEHLRPYLLPIPETPDEAFELLLLLELAFDEKTSGPPPETGRDGSASSKN